MKVNKLILCLLLASFGTSLGFAKSKDDVRDITGSHVHVKTMAGPITLTNIRDGHVEIDSVSGDVTLTSVTGPLVVGTL